MKLERVEWEYKEMSPSSAWQMVHRTTWFYYTLSNIPNLNSRANKHANVYIYIAWNVHNPGQKLECNCYDQAIRENKINPKHRPVLLTSSLLSCLPSPQKLRSRVKLLTSEWRNLHRKAEGLIVMVLHQAEMQIKQQCWKCSPWTSIRGRREVNSLCNSVEKTLWSILGSGHVLPASSL